MSRIKFTAAQNMTEKKNGKRCSQLCGWSYMELQLPFGCSIGASGILERRFIGLYQPDWQVNLDIFIIHTYIHMYVCAFRPKYISIKPIRIVHSAPNNRVKYCYIEGAT